MMKSIPLQKIISWPGYVLLALCLLTLHSGPALSADALAAQENNPGAAIGQTVITTTDPIVNHRIPIDFSPYIDGQDPNTGTTLPEAQIRQRLQMIAPYSTWVRSFSCGNGLEVIGRLAHEMNLQVAVNAWIGRSEAVNQQQISCLIAQANAGYVDLAVVGSEALLRGDVSADTLISYIDQVRQAIPPSIPVTTADVYTPFLQNPVLVDHIDLIFVNIYPFWEGYELQHAVAMLNYYYNQLAAAYPAKTIKISETGWPGCGSYGDAVGSLKNEALYFSQVDSWAHDKNVTLFYFDGLDEAWKAQYEGPQGACWGIWDKNGLMKEGMSSVFDGTSASVPYDLALPSTCDTDRFSFHFTYVPPYGSFNNVQGKTCGIFHKDHKIVLFINVAGNWWIKPYYASPKTPINPDGSWSIDYTTGGIDETATEFRAYLVPNDVDPFGDLSSYPMISVTRPTDAHAFDKSSPVDGATSQLTNPTLSWGSSLNSTSYEYCLDTNINDACDDTWKSNGTSTTKALTGLVQGSAYEWQVRAVYDPDTYYANNSPGAFWTFATGSDTAPPVIRSITRLNPDPAITNYVNFTVTFSEPVTGVDTALPFDNFILKPNGVKGAAITGVSGSGATYTVTVNTGSGTGTIRLDGVDDDSIKDAGNLPLGGSGTGNGNFTGESYTITQGANVLIGTQSIGNYAVLSHPSTIVNTANKVNGPVRVSSTRGGNLFTSERVISGTSFNEVMGYPTNQLTTEYWFPWYDNLDMATWLLVGNASSTQAAAVDIYIGGVKRASYSIPIGGRVTPRFNLQTGPVRVVSTNGVKIFTSERSLYGTNKAFNEVMGYPASQFATEYWFPWYDNTSMTTWVLVGNPSTTSAATVSIYIGGKLVYGPYSLPKGGKITPRFNITPAGPVRVVSTNGVKIFTSERVVYGDSFNEVMGYPTSQLTTEYFFPWYDNVGMATWVLVGNPAKSTATVDIYAGGVKKGSYTIAAGKQINMRFPLNTGSVRVVSTNGVKVFTSERVLYGSSFNEVMGYPGNQLTTEYWFTWYDSASMSTDIVVGMP